MTMPLDEKLFPNHRFDGAKEVPSRTTDSSAPLDEKGPLPCPFCDDPMKVVHGTLSHVDQGGCPIGAYAWGGANAVEAWNRRAYLAAAALPDELEVVAWDRLRELIGEYFNLGYAEGVVQRDVDTMAGDAQLTLSEIEAIISQAHSIIAALRAEMDEAQQELKAHDLSFDLRYKSDMRACKRWQEATGRTMTLPDHTDLSMWLFAQLETAERNRDAGVRNLLTMQGAANKLRQRAETAEAEVKRLTEALNEIRELNMSGADENGHRWANSDLIEQTVVFALSGSKE